MTDSSASTPTERIPLDRTKLLAARFRAANERPYFAAALYSLTIVESDLVGTMAVDRWWRCYVSPRFVAETPVEQLAGVWIHEMSHVLRDHHSRAEAMKASVRGEHVHLRMNIAMDIEINDDLVADGATLPPNALQPSTFHLDEGLLFENYLESLPPIKVIYVDWGAIDCGCGAHGEARPWELGPLGAPSISDPEADAIRRQIAQELRGLPPGTVAAGWGRWANAVLEPTVDWRTVLAGAVREAVSWSAGAADYTYRRPSRRGVALRGVVLPSMQRPTPRVAIVIDTSGSMNEELLAVALTETEGVMQSNGFRREEVLVLSCDAAVHAVQHVRSVDEIELFGGGGTDMGAGIHAALDRTNPPTVIIVLTDGYTPWPDEETVSARVIAGIIGDGASAGSRWETPPWIERVDVMATPPAAAKAMKG